LRKEKILSFLSSKEERKERKRRRRRGKKEKKRMDLVDLCKQLETHAVSNNLTTITLCLREDEISCVVAPVLGSRFNDSIADVALYIIKNSPPSKKVSHVTEVMNTKDPFVASLAKTLVTDEELKKCMWLIVFLATDRIINLVTTSGFPMTEALKGEFCRQALEMTLIEKTTSEFDFRIDVQCAVKKALDTYMHVDMSAVFVPPPTQTFMIYTAR
jgi:hypothetical protein